MPDNLTSTTDHTALAEDAAKQLFYTKDSNFEPAYQPNDLRAAEAAVRRLGKLFEDLPGAITSALERARDSANLLSSDRLQGLAEVVQNADDVGASQIRLCLRPTDLLISHDGLPVRLKHVLGLATPWLSTKGGEAAAAGRFGIGLMALRSLSTKIEVHCHPYHVRLGDPTIEPIAPPVLPAKLQEPGWTTLRVPFEGETVRPNEVEEWLNRWGDAGLLFLRHVSRITLLTPEGNRVCELTLSRESNEGSVASLPSGGVVSRHRAEADDGRSWMVYDVEVPTPTEVERAHKATEATTPIAVALPLWPAEEGQVYAGLPVATTGLPLFVNGQFDPLTNRQDFAPTAWNSTLVPLVAELWSQAALDLFSYDPQSAWLAMPTEDAIAADTISPVLNALAAAITAHAWQSVARDVLFPVPSLGLVSLSQLAVEAPSLEGILTEVETASLADLPATLPVQVRDQAGKWRSVLDGWRTAGADLPEPVSVEQALALLDDQTRPEDATIALVGAALDEGFAERLLAFRCVIADDGRRLTPPASDSPEAFAIEITPLGQRLGVVTLLHPAHRKESKAARTVMTWLRKCGALLNEPDDQAVVRRLAAAGQSGRALALPLTDEQVQALRDAFELIDPVERTSLAPNIGRAISLDAYVYEGKHRRAVSARPVDAYLPSAIDHGADSFAAAAKQTPGLVWMSDRYARVLRSSSGREGVGALKFLRLVGAKAVPRPRLHPDLEPRYSNSPLGLSNLVTGNPVARRQAMQERGVTYTLQDYDNPDLLAVLQDVASERSKQRRQKRAGALLASLGRAWESLPTEVDSAYDSYGWQKRGQIRAYWLWQAADVAWLDDERGFPRRPTDLRIRTAGAIAVHGENAAEYLHKDLDQLNRRLTLSALGVASDTSRSDLVNRLVGIRESTEGREGEITIDLKRDVAIVYLALAEGLATTARRTDLSPEQTRMAFRRNRLVLTNLGWRSPDDVLAGSPIFGDHRAFALEVKGADRLWRTLRLKEPSHDDCLEVLRELARQRRAPDSREEVVLLQTLRALTVYYPKEATPDRRLAQLALWTSKGWVRNRPVYATGDPVLAAGLQDRFPFWQPGGELEQFRPLLKPLRVSEISAAEAEVIDPTLAKEDADATALFQSALKLLREDLARNEPQLTEKMVVPWDSLEEFTVNIHPNLALRVNAMSDVIGEECVSEVTAKVDVDYRKIFVRDPLVLPRVEGGGRALAALFQGNARHLAHAWRVACDKAEEGRVAKPIELAQEHSERERAEREQQIETHKRTIAFQEQTAVKRRTASGAGRTTGSSSSGVASEKREQSTDAPSTGAPRRLVDPQLLRLLDAQGRIEGTAGNAEADGRAGGQSGESRRLAEPRQGFGGPRSRQPIRQYTEIDKETLGFELLRMVLGSDDQDISDLRAQRNVGADAMDDLGRFYELKVSADAELNYVTLTDAEVQRAQGDPDFFLVVVSGLEEDSGTRPTVRVIVNPLNQLRLAPRGSTTWSGVHEAKSLVYQFGPIDESGSTGGEEQ